MPRLRTLIPAAAGLLAVAGSLFGLAAQDLDYELVEGEWIVLHVWLPSETVTAVLPESLGPGRFTVDIFEKEPPGTMADGYLIIRRGTFRLPLAGKMVKEKGVLDMMILVAIQAPSAQREEGVQDFFLLDYATSDELLATLLNNAGIKTRAIEGTFSDRTLPSTQQEAQTTVTLAGYEPWNIIARSTNGRHYDLGSQTWRIFTSSTDQTLTISMRDDFYMRAASRITGLSENSPLDGFGEWRWADSDTLLFFTSGSTHGISLSKSAQ